MKKIIYNTCFVLLISIALGSCSDYLDIVPDKTQQISLLFERREKAYNALATCYHYLPQNDNPFSSFVFASDEVIEPIDHHVLGLDLMRGKQKASDGIMSFWSGFSAREKNQEPLWRGIRDCNTLIENIYRVADMTDQEKEQWKAEATFLKAYYHFLLVANYGPVPVIDKNVSITTEVDQEVMVYRQSVDQCFDYIETTIDKAIPGLAERITAANPMGRVDQVIARAIKSRILLYAASPLFNGNAQFYETFVNKNGNKLFNTTYDITKWEKAAVAAKEAIDAALKNGVEMYQYTDAPMEYDSVLYNQAEIKYLYNYRYMFTDSWNKEIIWGSSNSIIGQWWGIQSPILMKKPGKPSGDAWQWAAPTLRMVELYYTKNGLPITEDLSFNYDGRFKIVRVSETDKYHAQENEFTINLHLSREPRFYASIGFDRGYNRTYGELWALKMRAKEEHGKNNESYDNLLTGYAIKKLVHPSSSGNSASEHVGYAWPIIRFAELYLNYAEAMNEAYGPSQQVYNALNAVRNRVGLPPVEVVWADATLAKNPGKHTNIDGLRDIIRHERMIEMAFEGHRYFDIRRWKLGDQYFATPIMGLSIDETDANAFYVTKTLAQRSFVTPRDYLHPIKVDELIVNTNLVQNPGW